MKGNMFIVQVAQQQMIMQQEKQYFFCEYSRNFNSKKA
jgi:acetone carboxylase gamma subunit